VSAVFPGFWVGVVIAYWNGCSVSQLICCEDGEWLGLRMSSPKYELRRRWTVGRDNELPSTGDRRA
jgi:hypothetical protein